MNRTLKIRRLWKMGEFSNVELESTVSEIPEKVALNDRAIGLLYHLMLLEAEMGHKDYLRLYKDNPVLLKAFPDIVNYLDESLKTIKEDKDRTFEELMHELNKGE